MTLEEYSEFGLFDVGLQLVILQSCLKKNGISTKIEVPKLTLFVYASSDSTMQKSPLCEIYFDCDSYDIAVLSLKACDGFSIHPYLRWVWQNLSLEMKASMMKCMLEDPENGLKECF